MISDEYAAGFFDGEGSVYAAVTRPAARGDSIPTLLVCIGNTNRPVLEMHKSRWGGSISERGGKHAERVASGRYQRQYQWVLAPRMAKAFLLAVEPHLIIKKEVVQAALRYAALMETPTTQRVDYSHRVERNGRRWSSPITRPEFREKIMSVYAEIRNLNARAAPGNALRGAGRIQGEAL